MAELKKKKFKWTFYEIFWYFRIFLFLFSKSILPENEVVKNIEDILMIMFIFYLHYNFMRNHNIPIFIGKKNKRY